MPENQIDQLAQLAPFVIERQSDIRLYRLFDLTTGVGNRSTFRVDFIPDFWIVALAAIDTIAANVFQDAGEIGVPIRLYSGGYAKLPGTSFDLTVSNSGLVQLAGTVVALKNMDMSISPGQP